VADLRKLVAAGARNAGPPPIPTLASGEAVEVDRVISAAGTFALGGQILVGAAILAGRQSHQVSLDRCVSCVSCRRRVACILMS
jgi:hypothetical protein